MSFLKEYIITLNLFRPPEGAEPESDHQQQNNIIATRVHLILLFIILLGLILATSLSPETRSITISNPTQAQYESLSSPTCPCSRSSLFYNQFISNNPTFHQVCSSQFVSEEWFTAFYFGVNTTYFLAIDFRATAIGQWQALASFCRLVQRYALQSLSLFGSTSFISSQALSRSILESQANAFLDRFQQTIPNTFETEVQLISEMFMGDQLLNALETSMYPMLYSGDIGFRVALSLNGFEQEDGSWCWCVESLACKGPSGFYDEYGIHTGGFLRRNYSARTIVPGFTSGCMPVDALRQSTLECFFNQTCVNVVVSYSQMPQKSFTAMLVQPSSRFAINATVQSIVNELMMEDWGNNVSFDKYYTACAPLSCTYSMNGRHNFIYVLTTLIGLLGGLYAGLSIIVPLVINFIRRQPNDESQPRIPFMKRLHQLKISLLCIVVELNLFEIHPSDQRQVRQERIATRLYILLLISALIILILYSAFTQEIYRETVKNPTQSQFTYLQSLYSISLNCPCSSVSNLYEIFLNVAPEYHQVCSSALVTPAWLKYLNGGLLTNKYYYYLDYRGDAIAQFQLLITFFQQAQEIISHSRQLFLQQRYVAAQVVPEQLFISQATAFIQDWQLTTVKNFRRTIQLIQVNRQGNQYMAGSYVGRLTVNNSGEIIPHSRIYVDDESQSSCDCALYVTCRTQMGIFDFDLFTYNVTKLFEVPGLYVGCYPVQALFESTLECYYNQSCMDTIALYLPVNTGPENFTALNASQNQANETIGSIIDRMFIDTWLSNVSFTSYYHACSPLSCTYEYTHRRSIISLVTIVIGIFGGLTTAFKIIIFILLKIMAKIRIDQSFSILCRSIKDWFFTLNNEQYLSNRLNIFLLVTTLTTLYLASALVLQSTTVQITQPSLSTYNNLLIKYPATLQCPCSQVSVQYGSFIIISSITYHQVCSSDFVTDQWVIALYGNGTPTRYKPVDYQFTAVSQFRFLSSVCQLTTEAFNDALLNLNKSELIDFYLVSPIVFEQQIQSSINQFQNNTPNSFLGILQLVRDMSAANTLMNLFETNWKWINMSNNLHAYAPIRLQAVTYGICDCGLSIQCVQAAAVANGQSIPGLLIGCYPIEAFLQSTLECLYNSSCIRQLHSTNRSFTPLNVSHPSQYQVNSTVREILSQLMVEQWSTNTTYETYFTECAPLFCTYSYLEHRPPIDVLTTLLGLYGGLAIIMKAVVPILINIWRAIKQRYNRVHPGSIN